MPRDFDNYNNLNTGNNQSYRASKRSTIKTVDPDVSGARKAYDDIFSYAKKSATEFNKFYVKDTTTTMKTVANITLNTYSKMFKSMESMHKSYLDNMVRREFNAANEVSKAWSNARSGSPVGTPSRSQSSGDYGIGKSMRDISDSLDSSLDRFNRDNEKITERTSDVVANKTSGAMSKVGGKLLELAKQYLDIWLQRFQRGIDNIYNTYESTYTNVSVLMRQNQDQYIRWQTTATDEITARGLKDNVAISEVMKTLDQVVQMGLSGQEAQNKALADTINKTIAPFVDTASEAYTDLQLRLGDTFTNNITGMGAYVQDIAGSSRVFKNSINDIVTKLEPVQLYAEKQLMSGEEYAMVEQLVNSGLMTTSQAVELVSQASQVVSDQYGALTSGNIAQAIAVAGGHTATLEDAITGMLGSTTVLQNRNSALAQGAAINAYGVGGFLSQSSDMVAINDLIRNFSATGSASDFAKRLGKEFADNAYTTATAQRAIWSENSMLGIAQFREQYPDAYDILQTISTTLIAMAGSQIFNSFTGGGGIGGLTKAIKGIPGIIKGIPSAISSAAPSIVSAGLAAGGIVAIKMGADEFATGQNNLRYRGDTTTGRAQTALGMGAMAGGGIAAGAGIGGILAGGASVSSALAFGSFAGPIGLAIAGGAIIASKVVEHYSKLNKALNDVRDSYSEQRQLIEEENESRKDAIESLREQYDSTSTLEEKRKLLIEQGIASEEELSNKTTKAIDNMFTEYEEREKRIANGGVDEWYKFFAKTLDIFDQIPDSLGDAYLKHMQELDEQELKEKQSETAKGIANKLAGMTTTEERVSALEDMGVDFSNVEDASRNYKLLTATSAEEIESALNEATGFLGSRGTLAESWDTESMNLLNEYYDTGVGKYSDNAELNAKVSNALDIANSYGTVTRLKSKDLYKNDSQYREALDIIYGSDVIEDDYIRGFRDSHPRYASGTPYVHEDGLAYLHKGEAVLNKYQNMDYIRASAITNLFGTGISASDILSRSRSSSDSDSKDYTEITDAISACARLVVDAINSMNESGVRDRNDDSIQSLSNRYYNRQRYNTMTDEGINMVNLQPSMVG